MGIQYVTVKIDTSGLYQPLSSAVGIVGIIGPAPSAGAGFSNPTLFTRPLVGASGEPYAPVVPVLKVAALVSDTWTLSITGNPTGGTFTLTFNGQTTGAIPFNATSVQVQSALTALSSVGLGNIVCTGGPLPSTNVVITFAGQLAFQPQPVITGTGSLTGGTTPAPTLAHIAKASLVTDVQTLSLSGNPTGGTFTLTFNNQTTAAIPFNATSAQVQAALVALSSIGPGNVVCAGGPLPGASVTINFAGQLAFQSQPVITGTSSLTSGATPAPAIAHTTTGAIIPDVQTLSVSGTPTGGTFTLTFNNHTTAAIPFNATSAQVQAALIALSEYRPRQCCVCGRPAPRGERDDHLRGAVGLRTSAADLGH